MYLFEKQLHTLCLLTLFLGIATSTAHADVAADLAALPTETPADVTGLRVLWGRIKTIITAQTSTLNATTMDALWNAVGVASGFDPSTISDRPLYQLILDTLTLMSNPKLVTNDSQQAITDFISSTPGFAGLTPTAPPAAANKPAASKPAATGKPATSKPATTPTTAPATSTPAPAQTSTPAPATATTAVGQTKAGTTVGAKAQIQRAKRLGRVLGAPIR